MALNNLPKPSKRSRNADGFEYNKFIEEYVKSFSDEIYSIRDIERNFGIPTPVNVNLVMIRGYEFERFQTHAKIIKDDVVLEEFDCTIIMSTLEDPPETVETDNGTFYVFDHPDKNVSLIVFIN